MRDSDIRRATLDMLRNEHAGDDDTTIVEEMGVWSGSVRIDIAVINGELSGYELKSNRDTLERLPLQVELYGKVFDKVSLIVGEKHVAKASKTIPAWWGIVVATERDKAIELRRRRRGSKNPSQDPYLIAQLLWKDEALRVLASIGCIKGWRGRRARDIHEHLAVKLSKRQLLAEVRNALKARSNWLRQGGSHQGDMAIGSELDPRF